MSVDQLIAEIVAAGWLFSLHVERTPEGPLTYQAYVWNDDPNRAHLAFAPTAVEALSEALRRFKGRRGDHGRT